MGARRIRREQRRTDMAESRIVNGMAKRSERERRDQRMKTLIKKGKLPFTPPIMSWLSVRLNKPSKQISQAEIDKLLA